MNPIVVMLLAASLAAPGLMATARASDHLPPLPRPERTQSSNAASARPLSVLPTLAETPSPLPAVAARPPASSPPGAQPAGTVPPAGGHVARATFTRAIENREPVEPVADLEPEAGQIYFFTELRDMTGQIARHRWEYNDRVVVEKAFEIKGPRWRVWSGGPVSPERAGTWKVTVLNDANHVLAEQVLRVKPPSRQPAP